ncbi:hypothetical protein QBC43DRAFT_311793 [Cladorrhinum sp. PSN259]|nr:hypothetical protein QBC43DRAFT_311793 [Cladorrhinum sp. PSN259]
MSQYVYSPLPRDSIRLLRIHPNPDENANIDCELFECHGLLNSERTSFYEALSYVWGSADKPRTMLVNGRYSFPLGDNLHAALHSLRGSLFERLVWVDAVCINQEDNDEKAHQVQSMARIYARARSVIVWLGLASSDSGRALEVIQTFAMLTRGSTEPQKSWGVLEKRATVELLRRPWFSRIWVLQEVAAARNIVIKCGADEISGYAFSIGLENLAGHRSKVTSDPITEEKSKSGIVNGLIRSTNRLIQGAGLRPLYEKSDAAFPRHYLNIDPLYRLVDMYRRREATDRRDKIYALLGMSSDDSGASNLLPDYTVSWKTAIHRFTKRILNFDRVNVDAWDDSDMVLLRGRGCVLATIEKTKYDDSPEIQWSTNAAVIDKEYRQVISNSILSYCPDKQAGDVIYLLEGTPTIILVRIHMDYLSVRHLVYTVSQKIELVSPSIKWIGVIPLVWDWGSASDGSQPEYLIDHHLPRCIQAEIEGDFNKAVRMLNTLLIRATPIEAMDRGFSRHTIVDWEERNVSRPTMEDDVLDCRMNNFTRVSTEAEMELLETYDRLSAAVGNGDIADGVAITKLFVEVSGRHADWPICQSILWLAASTRRINLVARILESGEVSGLRELRLAVATDHCDVVEALLGTGLIDPLAKDDQGQTIAMYAMARRLDWDPAFKEEDMFDENGIYPNVRQVRMWKYKRPRNRVDAQNMGLEAKQRRVTRIFELFLRLNPAVGGVVLCAGMEAGILGAQHLTFLKQKYRLDLKTRDERGRTLLMLAAVKGDEELARYLIENGHAQNHDGQDIEGQTPLMLAIQYNWLHDPRNKMINFLFHTGYRQLEAQDHRGRTALMLAAGTGLTDVVLQLINDGQCQINAQDKNGETALMHAAAGGFQYMVAQLIRIYQADLHARNRDGLTLLMLAARNGWTDAVRYLVENGQVDLNEKDENGGTALIHAAAGGTEAYETVKYLVHLDRVDLSARDKSGLTLLMWAASNGWKDIANHLLQIGEAQLNVVDQEGRTALMHALGGPTIRLHGIYKSFEIAYSLIENVNVDIEVIDAHGESVFTWMRNRREGETIDAGDYVKDFEKVSSVDDDEEVLLWKGKPRGRPGLRSEEGSCRRRELGDYVRSLLVTFLGPGETFNGRCIVSNSTYGWLRSQAGIFWM